MEECKRCRGRSGYLCTDCHAMAMVSVRDEEAWQKAIAMLEDELDERRYRGLYDMVSRKGE